jgi:hypothetical protein
MFYGCFCHKRVSNYKFQPDVDMQVLTETETSFSNNVETSGGVIYNVPSSGKKKIGHRTIATSRQPNTYSIKDETNIQSKNASVK